MTDGEKETRSMSEIIKKLTQQNEEKLKEEADPGDQTSKQESPSDKSDVEEAQKKLSGLISKMREYESEEIAEEAPEPPAPPEVTQSDAEKRVSPDVEEESVTLPDEEKNEQDIPSAEGAAGDDDATLKNLIDDILKSHDDAVAEQGCSITVVMECR